jgi:4-aminobutyrate aminotransferase-like enzyme
VGAYLRARLRALADRHALIGDVRGAGLFIAVDLVADRASRAPAAAEAARVVNGLRERQVLLSTTGEAASSLKIRPPLVFGTDHADQLVDTLDTVLAGL